MTKRQGHVLITGASSGIGLELARIFAADGHDLIIVSDDRAKLEEAASRIMPPRNKPAIDIVVANLARPDGARHVRDAVTHLGARVDVLVNNAGAGVWGDFTRETDLNEEQAIIQLNVLSVVALTKYFAPGMAKRRSARFLITASEASLAPIALMSIYAATKAFVYSFAQSLRAELEPSGVTVTALCPGATQTNFFIRAGMADARFVKEGRMADPAEVARDGYDALMRGDDHVVTPFKDRVLMSAAKFMPDARKVERVE